MHNNMTIKRITLLPVLPTVALFSACYPDYNEHRMQGVVCYDDIDSVPSANFRLAFVMSNHSEWTCFPDTLFLRHTQKQ